MLGADHPPRTAFFETRSGVHGVIWIAADAIDPVENANDPAAAEQFLDQVDSAIVMVNASTQYADGGEFGFGGEIGIATGKLHARGPVGAEQLTIFKYKVRGTGQARP